MSQGSVSRVIAKTTPVNEKTRSRVDLAIRKLGYKANLLAKGPCIKSFHIIGLAAPAITSHDAFAFFTQFVEDSAVQQSYQRLMGRRRT